jgi:hypothetical protein
MSTGTMLGGMIGAVIGFVISGYNPYGAYMGFMMGAGIGAMIDPPGKHPESPGAPQIADIDITTSEYGIPIIEVLGISKIVGNLIWYGHNYSEPVTDSTETGGKGGGGHSQSYITGYKYYLSWATGLCVGPVTRLVSIFRNEDLVWCGSEEDTEGVGFIDIPIEGMGNMTFYFGSADQPVDAHMQSYLLDSTLAPAYRGLCYAVFKNCYIGQYNRAPIMKFVFQKFPSYSFSSLTTVGAYNVNAAHALYWVMTELAGIPTSLIDDISFADGASELSAEGVDISLTVDSVADSITFLEEILKHIDGILRYSVSENIGGAGIAVGKFQLKLLRNEGDASELPEITEDDMLSELQIERKSWLDTKNELRVSFPQRRLAQGMEDPNSQAGELVVGFNKSTMPSGWYLESMDVLKAEFHYMDMVARMAGFSGVSHGLQGLDYTDASDIVIDGGMLYVIRNNAFITFDPYDRLGDTTGINAYSMDNTFNLVLIFERQVPSLCTGRRYQLCSVDIYTDLVTAVVYQDNPTVLAVNAHNGVTGNIVKTFLRALNNVGYPVGLAVAWDSSTGLIIAEMMDGDWRTELRIYNAFPVTGDSPVRAYIFYGETTGYKRYVARVRVAEDTLLALIRDDHTDPLGTATHAYKIYRWAGLDVSVAPISSVIFAEANMDDMWLTYGDGLSTTGPAPSGDAPGDGDGGGSP